MDRYYKDSAWQADDDLVFANPDTGKPLGRTKLVKRYKDALKRAGVRSCASTAFVHSFATATAAQGVPLRLLMQWLGHKDLATVQIYAPYLPGQGEAEFIDRAFAGVQVGVQTEMTSDDLADLATPEKAEHA